MSGSLGRELLSVGAGGFLGSMLRYGVSGLVHRGLASAGFPYGTLAVNLGGCLGIGLLAGLAEARQLFGPEVRLFLMVGLLGGFTTFSSFGYETFALLRDGETARALGSSALNLVLGVTLVWLGYAVTGTR